MRRFDKIVRNDFERAQHDPKGGGQEARSNPAGNVVFKFSES